MEGQIYKFSINTSITRGILGMSIKNNTSCDSFTLQWSLSVDIANETVKARAEMSIAESFQLYKRLISLCHSRRHIFSQTNGRFQGEGSSNSESLYFTCGLLYIE